MGKIQKNADDFELEDIWRVKNPTLKTYTFCQKKPLNKRRLNYCYTSHISLQNNITLEKILTQAQVPGRRAIRIELKSISSERRGPLKI